MNRRSRLGGLGYPTTRSPGDADLAPGGQLDRPDFNDRGYQRKLARAARLSGPERYLTYGKLDLDLAHKAAPLAAFGNLPNYDFFSARIGRQTFGVYGVGLAALCIKHTHG